jgi:hypothetical protein
MLLGPTTAGAAGTGTGPQWFTPTGVNQIRSAGSETSYYIMARIGDLYTQTSIYGCTLSTDNRSCLTASDGDSTNVLDDYSRQEYINGAGVGSGTGLKMLCGLSGGALSGAPTVDFARTSRAAKSTENGGNCPSAASPFINNGTSYNAPVDLAYADDSIAGLAFPFVNQAALVCGGTCSATQLGPVASGWVPGDPLAGPYTNNPLNDLANTETTPGGGINTSIIHRIQCGTGTAAFTGRISDWGQLTDKTVDSSITLTKTNGNGVQSTYNPTLGQEGNGAKIGIPIYVPAVNTNSGTESVWQGFAGCASTGVNLNGDPNNVMQENDAPQLLLIGAKGGSGTGGTSTYLSNAEVASGSASNPSATYFPAASGTTDNIYANNLLAASIYYVSYGVSTWKPYTVLPGLGKKTTINSISNSQRNETLSTCLAGCQLLATQRQLHNYVNPKGLRASTLGFMNWICDTDGTNARHGLDLTTGVNYSAELTNTIGTIYFFPREDCFTASNALVPTDTSS